MYPRASMRRAKFTVMRTRLMQSFLTWLFAGLLVAAMHHRVLAQEGHEHVEPEHPPSADAGTAAHKADEDGDSHAAEGGVNYDEPPMTPDRSMLELFVFSLLLFVGFVFLSRQLVWQPLIAGLDSREERVNQAYARAESMKTQVQQLIREHEAQIATTYEQVKAIVAESRQDADRVKSEITSAAAVEAQALQEQAIAEIGRAKEQALAELTAAADQYATLASDHVLGYSLSNR
jgi:F0F1-type ATP synthase membrane subunit b/b'